MKVNYELTLEDSNIFVKETFFIKRIFHKFIKEQIISAIVFSLTLSLLLPYLLFGFKIVYILLIFAGALPLYYIIEGLKVYYWGGKYVYRNLEGLDKNYELIIEEDIIKRTSSSGENLFNWNNVRDIYNTKRNIIIFISDRQAIIIPKRIFNSEQEINNFWNSVSAFYRKINEKSV